MSSDSRKLALLMYLQEKEGLSDPVAGRAVLASMPLDDAEQPSRAFEKGARKLAKQFSKRSKHLAADDTDRLARQTLEAIKALAIEHGEGHYAQRYDQALAW